MDDVRIPSTNSDRIIIFYILHSQPGHNSLVLFQLRFVMNMVISEVFMRLRPDEEARLNSILAPIRSDSRVLKMKNYIQHGRITTFDHVESVTRLSFWINKRLHIGADDRVLTIGAFLHDYYLYDWHVTDDGHGLHGFSHSNTAKENAINDFGIGKRTQDVIESHMWPLNITKVPKSRAAWIVCIADKCVSTRETLLCR